MRIVKFISFLKSQDKYFLIPLLLSISTSLVVTVTILILLKVLPIKLPLFYSLPWGDSQLVSINQFFILPATLFLMTLINLFLAWQLHPSQSFLKKALLLSLVPISLIVAVTAFKIVTIFF